MESESNHREAIVKQVMPMMRIPDRWEESSNKSKSWRLMQTSLEYDANPLVVLKSIALTWRINTKNVVAKR